MSDSHVSYLKLPPHSVESERSVLGGLLIDNSTWDNVSVLVYEIDFYRQDHRVIFIAIFQLAEKNEPYDVITLSEWLVSNNNLNNVSAGAYDEY